MDRSYHPRHTRLRSRLVAALILLAGALAAFPAHHAAAAPFQPVSLEFNGNIGPITNFQDTGFTDFLPGTRVVVGDLRLDNNVLRIAPTSGDLAVGSLQDNALAIQYDSQGFYSVGARLLKPFSFTSTSQSAGIYIGKDQKNFIRFTAGIGAKRSSAPRLQLDVMDRGKLRSSVVTLPTNIFDSMNTSLDLFLNIDHAGSGQITALYRVDSDIASEGRVATTRSFPRWLRQGGAVPVYAGVVSTNGKALAPVNPAAFDWFRTANVAQVTASVVASKSVDKDGVTGGQVNPGATLTYTITVSNNGAATSIQVVDPIPVDTFYVPNSATNGALFDSAHNQVTFQLGSLSNGQTATFTFKVQINQAPLQSSTIANTASVYAGGSTVASLVSAFTLVSGTPDLSGSSYTAEPATVGPNGLITYSLALQNDGPGTATNAAAQLTIPDKTTYVQGSAKASRGQLTIDPSLTLLTWAADGPMTPDSTATVTFTVRATGSFLNNEPITSQAIVQADGALPTVETAQALFVDASSVGTVSGTKVVDKTLANIGDTLTYTITVLNNSSAPATNLQVVDSIPQDASFVNGSLSIPAIGTATYDSITRRVNWQIPSLAASQSVTISLKAIINPLLHSSVILNKAVLTNPNAGVSQTLLATSTIVQNVADLSDSAYTATPATVGANGTVTYTLNLLSNGTAAATGATAHLTIPGLTGVVLVPNSAKATSGSISQSGSQLNWTAGGSLPIGAVVKISFQVKVSTPLTNGTPIPSSATVQATGTLSTILTTKATYSTVGQAPQYLLYIPVIHR